MGENVLALVRYMTSSSSPLPRMRKHSPPNATYMSFLGRYFVTWSSETSALMYGTFFYGSLVVVATLLPAWSVRVYCASVLGVVGGLVGAIVGANVVALIMTVVLRKGMTWFAFKWSPMVLYGLPALTGEPPCSPSIRITPAHGFSSRSSFGAVYHR
jgi:hypothetical protein